MTVVGISSRQSLTKTSFPRRWRQKATNTKRNLNFERQEFAQQCDGLRCETPPSSVSVCTDSTRTRFNCGERGFRQSTESNTLFQSISIWVKGGWKETRGLQRPIPAEMPVSESRMASLNPFETKRKKAPTGASSRVCGLQMAEGANLAPNSLYHLSLCNHLRVHKFESHPVRKVLAAKQSAQTVTTQKE